MATPDASLGIDLPDFDNDGFRAAIQFAQQMGTPGPDMRPKFIRRSSTKTYWKDDVQVFGPRLGRDGNPLDADIDVRSADPEIIEPDVSVEIDTVEEDELPVGNFRPTKATVTLLDTQYELVQDCREMTYNGDRYLYGYEPEVVGLFEVDVHFIVFYCLDES